MTTEYEVALLNMGVDLPLRQFNIDLYNSYNSDLTLEESINNIKKHQECLIVYGGCGFWYNCIIQSKGKYNIKVLMIADESRFENPTYTRTLNKQLIQKIIPYPKK